MAANEDNVKYSLWIELPGFVALRFNSLIEALASQHGGPRFTSHITLLGGLSGSPEALMQKTKELAGKLTPIDITLDGLGFEESFYQALFLKARGDSLFKARKDAQGIFAPYTDTVENAPYVPHLSIFYGMLAPEARDSLIKSLGGAFGATFKAEGLTLYKTTGLPAYWSQTGKQVPFG